MDQETILMLALFIVIITVCSWVLYAVSTFFYRNSFENENT
jgi:uncharacterized membrane protein